MHVYIYTYLNTRVYTYTFQCAYVYAHVTCIQATFEEVARWLKESNVKEHTYIHININTTYTYIHMWTNIYMCIYIQVTFEGKKGSLFDYLEDLDADTLLQRAQQIS